MFSAGFLAVVFYRQRNAGSAITPLSGGKLGALGGFFCFALLALLVAFASMVPELRTRFREGIIENADKWAAAHGGDAQVQAALEQMKTPEGFIMMMILGGILLLVCSIILGAVGGAMGGGIFGRRDRS
jgi:hypothetical protein